MVAHQDLTGDAGKGHGTFEGPHLVGIGETPEVSQLHDRPAVAELEEIRPPGVCRDAIGPRGQPEDRRLPC